MFAKINSLGLSNQTQAAVLQIKELINDYSSFNRAAVQDMFINIHTIKGTARTYKFASISNSSHEIEDVYQKFSTPQKSGTRKNFLPT